MTREGFIFAIAKEMAAHCGVDDPDELHAEASATLEVFEETEGAFGSEGFSWDEDSAVCMAREEMSYWEE